MSPGRFFFGLPSEPAFCRQGLQPRQPFGIFSRLTLSGGLAFLGESLFGCRTGRSPKILTPVELEKLPDG